MDNTDRFSVAFYNVENLFPPDPPTAHKLDPTPSGHQNWDQRKYENKLQKIAQVFQLMSESDHAMPALIGLAEIQGRKPLEDLVRRDPFNSGFGIVHYESMDERGVDVALLYDKSRVEIIFSEPLSYFFEIEGKNESYYDTTRDVLHCRVKIKDVVLNVFVLHLPSKREKDVNRFKRKYILHDLNVKIKKLLQENGSEAVLVCGDFNDNPDEELLVNFTKDQDYNLLLRNPYSELFITGQFSTYHYKNGLLFDQMLLSGNMFDHSFPLQFANARVFNHEKLNSWESRFLGRPFRTYSGTRYLGGYSDHFPIITELNFSHSKFK